MNEINLLPERYKNKASLGVFIRKTAVVMAVVCILPVCAYFYIDGYVNVRRNELSLITETVNDEKYALSDRAYHELSEINDRVGAVLQRRGYEGRADLTGCLNAVFAAAPDGLRTHEISYAADNSRFTFSGTAKEKEPVLAFIAALGADFQEISLISFKRSDGGEIIFTVEFHAGGGTGSEIGRAHV